MESRALAESGADRDQMYEKMAFLQVSKLRDLTKSSGGISAGGSEAIKSRVSSFFGKEIVTKGLFCANVD